MWFSGIVVRFIFVLFLISSHLAGHYNTFFERSPSLEFLPKTKPNTVTHHLRRGKRRRCISGLSKLSLVTTVTPVSIRFGIGLPRNFMTA